MFRPTPFMIPFLLFLFSFLVDKLFLLGNFPLYYLTTASFINFEHKENLIFQLKKYLSFPERKKVLVILGNSRSMSFHNDYINSKYPQWILFNFSVPGGTQEYFLYIIEKFKTQNIQPEAVFFAVTPQGMNSKPLVKTDEVMVFGLPPDFIFKYISYFSVDQLTNYIGKKLFITYKYRPKLRVINARRNDLEMLRFVNFLIKNQMILEQERGSIPELNASAPYFREEFIEKNAESIWKDFFTPFILEKNAIRFLNDCIQISKELKIPQIALFWPPVSPALKKRKQEKIVAILKEDKNNTYTVKEIWEKEMKSLAQKNHIDWYDFNFSEPMNCNYFIDASHLSSFCIQEYTDKIFQKLR